MANIKVSEMTEATSFDDGDYTMIVQANQNKKISKENMIGNIESNIGTLSNLETVDKSNIVNSINSLVPVALFNGTTADTVTLSDSAANYSYIEIFFEGANNFSSVKVFEPNNKNVYLISGWLNNNTNGNIKIANVNISGTSITKINYSAINYSTNSIFTNEENGITIRKVLGYK